MNLADGVLAPLLGGTSAWHSQTLQDVSVQFEPDFDRALAGIQDGARTVLVTGSFHTVGDAMARLPGFAPIG